MGSERGISAFVSFFFFLYEASSSCFTEPDKEEDGAVGHDHHSYGSAGGGGHLRVLRDEQRIQHSTHSESHMCLHKIHQANQTGWFISSKRDKIIMLYTLFDCRSFCEPLVNPWASGLFRIDGLFFVVFFLPSYGDLGWPW